MVKADIEAIAKAGLAKVRSAFFPWQKVSLEVGLRCQWVVSLIRFELQKEKAAFIF